MSDAPAQQNNNGGAERLLHELESAATVPGVSPQNVERILVAVEAEYEGWPCAKCDGPAGGRWTKELRERLRDVIDAEIFAFCMEKRG